VSFAIVSSPGANKDFAIDTSVPHSLQAVKKRTEWDGLGSEQLPRETETAVAAWPLYILFEYFRQ